MGKRKLRNSEEYVEDTSIYIVEKILEHRKKSGRNEFLVKWEGYSHSENTWEPEINFVGSEAIHEYFSGREKDLKHLESKTKKKKNAFKNKPDLNSNPDPNVEVNQDLDELTKITEATTLNVKKVIDVKMIFNRKFAFVSFDGSDKVNIVTFQWIAQRFPQKLIEYFEQRIIWHN